MDIGFIGLGHMGGGIAANLVRTGHHVRVWNRSAEPVERLLAIGAKRADSPAAAFDSDVMFSMLANDEAIEQVVLSPGALDQARKGMVHVNLATISVGLARHLTELHVERGLGSVAAPVLGRPDVAAAGELNCSVPVKPPPPRGRARCSRHLRRPSGRLAKIPSAPTPSSWPVISPSPA